MSRGTQASPDYPRSRMCWACGLPFVQRGPGRSRLVCYADRCKRKRAAYRNQGLARFDHWEAA